MNDIIFLNGMRFYGYHGVLAAENDIGQIFVVDITLKVDLSYAGQSDEVVVPLLNNILTKSVDSIQSLSQCTSLRISVD